MNKKRLFFILLILICCLCLTTVNAQDMNNITEVDEDSSIELVGDVGDSNDLLSDSVNDVYFDASQENDNGDGSKEHPYKYLNARKLSSNCIAHFASGEYKLDTLKYIYSDIQFIGENSENTIIKYKGMAFSIGVGYSLTASGLTFKNAAIRNFGTLDCNDCIFKESTAAFVDDYENSFGGAIYCKIGGYSVTYSPGAYLTNCTFSNNYAAYGGAIYIEGGVLNIDDSTFIDNAASGFGGAIAAEEGSTLTITNSNFNKDISKGDAGGAIYSKTSSVIIRNSNFNDCKSFFGGALCNLYGQLSVSDSRFNNNSAKYEGGAIYGMYGRLSTTKSEFRNNSASNAGAIFIDNCTNIVISNSNFDFNMALVSGGAIFYNAATRITNSSNKFSNNKALSDSDVHFQENYPTYIKSNGNNIIAGNYSDWEGELPSYYNLYDEGLLTPVKDQQSGGNCWGFSAIAALESSILKVANLTFDYSEENMKNLIEIYSAYGWKMDTNQGGYDNMAIGYLTSWLGPIFEVNDTYDDYSTLSTVLDSVLHIQDVFYVPARSNYTDNDAIKHAILKYGAVSASYYHSSSYYNPLTYGYYYPGIGGGNHAITIIGWDDNYSKDNFYYTPAGDGAFIIKNSWNETWGEDGFFYISYYDGILYAVGNPQACYGFILTNDNNYTKNYQYDFAGLTDYLITGKSTMWYANEFNSTSNEYIAAFSTYFNSTTDWEAEIYVNGYLKHTQNGTSSSGYHTIDLDELVSVNIGDTFRISLKITSARYAIIPISEAVSTTRTYYKPGVSFMSFNGKSWIDLYDYQFKYSTHTYTSQVACIKAFTFDRPNTNTTIDVGDVKSNVGNIFNVIANVMDNDGNLVNYGFVNFTIDNNTYSIRVSNGIANLTFSFNQTGEYEVIAKYWALEGFNPSNTTANINITKMPISLNLTIDNIIYGDKVVAHIQSNADDLKLTIAGKTYDVNSTEFILPYILDAGEYVAVLSYDGSDKYLSNSTTAKFNVGVKIINMSTTVNNLTLEIKLSENINATVSILIDNMSQRVNIVNGMANVNVSDLKYGNHSYEVKFSDKNYNNIINEGVIEINNINVVIIAPDVTKYFAGPQRFVINITDGDGNPISGLDMIISINGGLYKRTSDENGTASIAINLNSGEYEVGVVINATGDYTAANNTSKVTVLPTIEANDLTKVFRNASQYRATFKDSEGNLIKNTTVSFNINGIYYNRTTDDEGVAQLNINLEQGTYILTAINPLNGEMHTNIVNVTSRLIENNDLVKFYKNESQFKVLLIGDDGNPAGAGESVSFNINGIFYTKASDENGYVTLNINLYPGEYIMTTEYKGCRVANTIKVLPVLSGNDITMNYGDGTQFEATLLDGQGKAYPNREITFNINGVFYTRTTDNDGIAHLNINLMSGEYIITSIYNGVNVANKITII